MEIKGCSLFCRILVVFTLGDLEAAPQTYCSYLVEVLVSLVLPKFSGCRSSLVVSDERDHRVSPEDPHPER